MQPAKQPPAYPIRIVIKYRSGTRIPYKYKAEKKTATASIRDSFDTLNQRYPKATLKPLFSKVRVKKLRKAVVPNNKANEDLVPVEDLSLFFCIEPDPGQDFESLLDSLNAMPDVDYAYLEGSPAPPPDFDPSNDTLARFQDYILPAPVGINAIHANKFPGGDGQGVQFIDIEQGWLLNHEDLLAANIQLLWGVNKQFFDHGTAVLGQMVATDNDKGIVGIARNCRAAVISQWSSAGRLETAQAILKATESLLPGDVLLIEAQIDVPLESGNYFPVEVERATMEVLRHAFNKGIIVIEAAGNGGKHGGNNLNSFVAGSAGTILNPNTTSFIDSMAIMVGAASSSVPHQRLPLSNFGTRVNCYAWGEKITTTGNEFDPHSKIKYTHNFGGTSGASPIIAGAAVVLQAVRQATSGTRFSPREMRALLSATVNGTPSANPSHDQIGVMPDLKTILNNAFPGVA